MLCGRIIIDAEMALVIEQQNTPLGTSPIALMNRKIEELVEARIRELLKGVKLYCP